MAVGASERFDQSCVFLVWIVVESEKALVSTVFDMDRHDLHLSPAVLERSSALAEDAGYRINGGWKSALYNLDELSAHRTSNTTTFFAERVFDDSNISHPDG